ncbi:hypothetical protein [Niveibacterium sp. COAC-50]|uniref:hypothetical protein n=1 Tax=Niveibacterium sp. COAC-50 TaxID=2729384 RepID=UPI001552C82F|nr:hypothetical protein [Niveibacterium sp. COAC-50]
MQILALATAPVANPPSAIDNLVGREEVQDFVGAFRLSGRSSIDAFLANRPEFAEVGKLAIAYLIMRSERAVCDWLDVATQDDLYGYLFDHLAPSNQSWDELDFSWLSVVTFNYDRSLEQALLTKLMAAYGRTRSDALKKLEAIQIVHVYGNVGGASAWPMPGERGYGGSIIAEHVQAAARNLRVIPEVRHHQSSPEFMFARSLLTNATHIAFLGFAFDPLNVERLGGVDTCRTRIEIHGKPVLRTVVATTYQMTATESLVARQNTRADAPQDVRGDMEYRDMPCVKMLRETGFFLR